MESNGATTPFSNTIGGWRVEPEDASNNALVFPLPSKLATLAGATTTPGWGLLDGPDSGPPADVNITWSISPAPDDSPDDPCHAIGSDIGCQSQTLGESLPILGTPFFLRYQSDRAVGRAGADSAAINDALGLGGWTLSAHHALSFVAPQGTFFRGNSGSDGPPPLLPKALFLGDGRVRSSSKMQTPLRVGSTNYVTSDDGSEAYSFDWFSGRHLQTLRPLTGAPQYTFGYDRAGHLITVTDSSNNITTIQRDPNGHPTAIVSPYGQTTTLEMDGNGYLSRITDPVGNQIQLVTDTGGLLQSLTDANGNVHSFQYDSLGRLQNDANPAGGSTTLTRTDGLPGNYAVSKTSALKRTSNYAVALSGDASSTTQKMTNTDPSGAVTTKTETQSKGTLSESTSLPDGTTINATLGPDPRWGIETPIPSSTTVTTPSGLQNQVSVTRAATLADPSNPLSLQTQTDTVVVNGRTSTRAYDSSTQTVTTTTPAGRQTVMTLDNLERVVQVAPPGVSPIEISYDTHGHVTGIAQGARVSMFGYDPQGFLATATDPLSNVTGFTRDANGRVTAQLLPDAQSIGFTYDPESNLTSLTPPGRPAHSFAYTAIDLLASYQPPALGGVPSVNTNYTYNVDGQLTQWSRPDGVTPLVTFDTAGRLTTLTIPEGKLGLSYDSAGRVATMTDVSGGSISYDYDGALVTRETVSGRVQGTLERTYDNDFRVTSTTLDGANAASFSYDPDSLLVQAGPLAITRDPQTGFVSATSAGVVTTSETRSNFGEASGWSAAARGNALYSATLTRDLDGRITDKSETIDGTTTAFTYAYDSRGRLTDVTRNGSAIAHYGYDANGNRTSFTGPSSTVLGTYDAQDRLLTYGSATYTFGANGELQSKHDPSGTTSYVYDALGNLRSATLADGTVISYVFDALNRRVGKTVNGTLAQGFLYENQLRPAAELDGNGNIVSRFVYATHVNVPDVIMKGGTAYRVLTDQVGSVRLVVSTSDGTIAQHIDYDEFGNVLADSSPGFQPFGFAGGIYDRDTHLVRLGARDYDASGGSWTNKDPLLFDGGDTNLYRYVVNDPVNRTDPFGTFDWAFGAVVNASFEGGAIFGTGGTAQAGVGTFFSGTYWNGLGAFASAGGFAGAGHKRACAPENGQKTGVLGGFVGVGAGVWVSNVANASDLEGTFKNVNINAGWLIGVNISIGWDDSGHVFVAGSGEGGGGASVSYYPTYTVAVP
jgi:RHS repeat-associated protein